MTGTAPSSLLLRNLAPLCLALVALGGCQGAVISGPVGDSSGYDEPMPKSEMCDEAYAMCPDDDVCQLPDSDGDGVVDPCDLCNGDDNKDSDGDETPDDCDECPGDPAKQEAGVCGCNQNDDDVDVDGVEDCIDDCPTDPYKSEAGYCGCGEAETNSDGDAAPDCVDDCPDDPTKTQDNDHDDDGYPDCVDGCPYNKDLQEPGGCGCHSC